MSSAPPLPPAQNPRLPPGIQRTLAASLFLSALTFAAWQTPRTAPAALAPLVEAPASQQAPFMVAGLLPSPSERVAHPSLTALPDGRIAAAWLGSPNGRTEDLAIWFSVLETAGWREPQLLASRESVAGTLFAHFGQIGSPVLASHGPALHLWFSASIDSGSGVRSLIHMQSDREGRQWRLPKRLSSAALAWTGSDVQTPPWPLAQDELALPITQGHLPRRSEWLRLTVDGQIIEKTRSPQAAPATAPAIVPLTPSALFALQPADDGPHAALGEPTGRDWQPVVSHGLPAGQSTLALLRLHSGRLLAAVNDDADGHRLQLWLSTDQGAHWQVAQTLDRAADGAASFVEPSLTQGSDGRIHLAYAWRHQRIKYLHFNEAWLEEGLGKPPRGKTP